MMDGHFRPRRFWAILVTYQSHPCCGQRRARLPALGGFAATSVVHEIPLLTRDRAMHASTVVPLA